MKFIDLTHKIKNKMSVYPGTPIPEILDIAVMEKEGYREKSLSITGHTGTHIDAPAHMSYNGKSIDEIELSFFSGHAVVFALDKKNLVQLHNKVKKLLDNDPDIKFLLFYTGWSDLWCKKEYYKNYPVIPEDLAKMIVASSVNGIGIDAPSIDESNSIDYPIHHLFFINNKIIIENMNNLKKLIDRKFQLCCFPLNINRGDGSPVRAVAFL